MTYTQLAVVGALAAGALDLVVLRTRLLLRRAWWVAYAIVLGFQLLANGALSRWRIVHYDPQAIIGGDPVRFLGPGRVVWAPVEDLVFGFALVLVTLASWVWWGRRGIQREPAAGPPRWRDDEPASH